MNHPETKNVSNSKTLLRIAQKRDLSGSLQKEIPLNPPLEKGEACSPPLFKGELEGISFTEARNKVALDKKSGMTHNYRHEEIGLSVRKPYPEIVCQPWLKRDLCAKLSRLTSC